MNPVQVFIEYTLAGIAAGGVYTLVGLGFVLVFKASGVFNFAMGDMMMAGAYVFYLCAVILDLHWVAALVIAVGFSCALAWFIEATVLRRMLGQPVIAVVMVTFGIGFVLRGIAAIAFGSEAYQLPALLARDPFIVGGIFIPGKAARGFALAVGLCAAIILVLRYSRLGIALRATAADQITAYSMGINVRRVFAAAWMTAAAVGTIAGIIAASVTSLTPDLGTIGLNVMAVVIQGGLNSVGGVIVAGLFVGWLEAMTSAYGPGNLREITPYIAVLAMLMIRPHGLFGTRPVERI